MRTKFNLLATLLMVVLCVCFTSCSDDEKDEIQDDKTLDLLIGSWEYELSSFTDEEGNVVSRQMETVTFNSDMSWTGVDYYIEVGYPDKETEKWGEGTYSYNKTTKELTLNNNIFESGIMKILKITENELSWFDGEDIMNYTRKK